LNVVLSARNAISIPAQTTGTKAKARTAIRTNTLCTSLWQAVHSTEVPFKAATHEHVHLPATGLKSTEALSWQRGATNTTGQWSGSRAHAAIAHIVTQFSYCDMTAWAILIVVMDNFTDHNQSKQRSDCASCTVVVAIGKGWSSRKRCGSNCSGGKSTSKAGGKVEVHESDPFR
jgi:hypothetical protein